MASARAGGHGAAGWRGRASRLCGADGPRAARFRAAGRARRAAGVSRGDARLEYPGASGSLVRDHGDGRGVPHAEPAADRRAVRRHAAAVGGGAADRQFRSRAARPADRRSRAGRHPCLRHRRAGRCVGRSARRRVGERARPGSGDDRGRAGMGRVRRDRAVGPVFHLRHDGRAERRHLHPPVELPAHDAAAAGRRARHHPRRRGARRGADVPRLSMGAAFRRAGGRREAGAAGPSRRRRAAGPR